MDDLIALEKLISSRMRRERFYGFAMGAALLLTLATGWPKAAVQHVSAYSVDVTNTATTAVPVRQSEDLAHEPFSIQLNPPADDSVSIKVPPHKRLVIIEVDCDSFTNTVSNYQVYGTTGGKPSGYIVPVNGAHVVNQSIHAVFDAGSTVGVYSDDTNGNDEGGQNVYLHGYYVDEIGYYHSDGY